MYRSPDSRTAGRWPSALLLLAMAALAAGCMTDPRPPDEIRIGGYSTKSLYRQDVRTVAVPIFTTDRHLFRRGLEFKITEAVIKQIETRTHYKVVPSDRADTLLEGQVVDFKEHVLTKTLADDSREVEATVYLKVVWRDLRSGQVLRKVDKLSQDATFVVAASETPDQASATAFDRLAERVVELMETDF